MADGTALMKLLRTIAAGEVSAAGRLLAASPGLLNQEVLVGATRQASKAFFFEEICHHVYAGDTALHVACAAHQPEIARQLIGLGADVRAKNRRGAEPLHYAVDGDPARASWDPIAQAATVTCLLEGGAPPNVVDKSGVAPLHRAVRTRCALAVRALLEGGADPKQRNKSGSTPLQLAKQTTGRGGSGSPEAKEQQAEIIRLLTTPRA